MVQQIRGVLGAVFDALDKHAGAAFWAAIMAGLVYLASLGLRISNLEYRADSCRDRGSRLESESIDRDAVLRARILEVDGELHQLTETVVACRERVSSCEAILRGRRSTKGEDG